MKRGDGNALTRQPILSGLNVAGEWFTPPALFADIEGRYGPFTVDVAADSSNAKCVEYFTKEDDGLTQKWKGRAWCNPPYKDLIRWVRKAYEEVRAGSCEIAVLLLPAQTSTAWFHDYALPFGELYWIRGKQKFGGQKDRALMPSLVVAFRLQEAAS